MNRSSLLIFLVSALVAATTSAWTCNATKVTDWMYSCDRLGSDDEKCKNGACHKALHYLVEDMVRDCYVSSGLGPATDLDKYRVLDDYCHGETPAPAPTTTPKPTSPPTPPPTPRPSTPQPTSPPTQPPTTTPAPTTLRPPTSLAPTTTVPGTSPPTTTPPPHAC